MSQLITTNMSETITPSVTEQPKVEATPQDKVLERLSADFGGETVKTLDPPKTETTPTTETTTTTENVTPPTAEEIDALKTQAKELGLPEDATKEQVADAVKAKTDATEWKIDEVVPSTEEENDGSWKGVIAELGLGDIPTDYAEEKGFEIVQDLFQKKLEAVKSEALSEAKFDRYSDVPENARGEAELFVEQMKAGETMQQIIEPLIQIQAYKAMDKEQLVRSMYESKEGWDAEMIDAQMGKIIEGGTLEVEFKIAKSMVDNYEKSLTGQRQQQIETFKNNQKAIQEQRVGRSNLELKVALDRVPEFLGKKLPDALKSQLLTELQSEAYRNMTGTPEQKVDYFLYNKFGKTAMNNFKDRALEKVVIENKQNQHNVPKLETGNVNRVEQNNGKSLAEQRLEQQFGT